MKTETLRLPKEKILEEKDSISPCELLFELLPLLKDYFEGQMSFDGEKISYILPNGRKFIISAAETRKKRSGGKTTLPPRCYKTNLL